MGKMAYMLADTALPQWDNYVAFYCCQVHLVTCNSSYILFLRVFGFVGFLQCKPGSVTRQKSNEEYKAILSLWITIDWIIPK